MSLIIQRAEHDEGGPWLVQTRDPILVSDFGCKTSAEGLVLELGQCLTVLFRIFRLGLLLSVEGLLTIVLV